MPNLVALRAAVFTLSPKNFRGDQPPLAERGLSERIDKTKREISFNLYKLMKSRRWLRENMEYRELKHCLDVVENCSNTALGSPRLIPGVPKKQANYFSLHNAWEHHQNNLFAYADIPFNVILFHTLMVFHSTLLRSTIK